jgi:hypothetical protein
MVLLKTAIQKWAVEYMKTHPSPFIEQLIKVKQTSRDIGFIKARQCGRDRTNIDQLESLIKKAEHETTEGGTDQEL